jgi:hypothetical protein
MLNFEKLSNNLHKVTIRKDIYYFSYNICIAVYSKYCDMLYISNLDCSNTTFKHKNIIKAVHGTRFEEVNEVNYSLLDPCVNCTFRDSF